MVQPSSRTRGAGRKPGRVKKTKTSGPSGAMKQTLVVMGQTIVKKKARKLEGKPIRHPVVKIMEPEWVVDLRDASPERIADEFGMSKAQLAEMVGFARETFHRASRAKAPKTQRRVTEMLEIISRVTDWAGGKDQAMAWYRAYPIPSFGGRTAESLVKDGKAATVRDYLDRVALGGFA
mgnify:CR=1 FL=1